MRTGLPERSSSIEQGFLAQIEISTGKERDGRSPRCPGHGLFHDQRVVQVEDHGPPAHELTLASGQTDERVPCGSLPTGSPPGNSL